MADDSAVRLGQAVRTAREQRGWTQPQLAEASGVSRPTIQRCENAKGLTSPPVGRALFLALGLDPRHLPVLLGYVNADEMGVPAQVPRVHSPVVDELIGLLDAAPAEVAEECLRIVRFRLGQR